MFNDEQEYQIKVEVTINPNGGGQGWPVVTRTWPTCESRVTGAAAKDLTREERASIVDPITRLLLARGSGK